MKTVMASKQGFERLWNRVKGNMRITGDEIPTRNHYTQAEIDAWWKERLNPVMPSRLEYWSVNGNFEIVRGK